MNLLDESKGKIGFYTGIPIVIVPTTRIQNKTHKKKRINKKWAKRYGFTEYCHLKDGETLMFEDKLYMNERTLGQIRVLDNIGQL